MSSDNSAYLDLIDLIEPGEFIDVVDVSFDGTRWKEAIYVFGREKPIIRYGHLKPKYKEKPSPIVPVPFPEVVDFNRTWTCAYCGNEWLNHVTNCWNGRVGCQAPRTEEIEEE